MRIIGGAYGGRKLAAPKDKNIRPTTDRMRETIFNILEHSSDSIEGANVLDVFAGTGALGLEALSRGAAHATFFDKDPAALRLVKRNVALLAVGEKSTVRGVSAPILPACRKAYDMVFLDPPYNLTVINDTLISLVKNYYLSDSCMIIIEYSSSNQLILPDYFTVIKEKIYGDACFSILKKISLYGNI